jgi:ribulose-5-phosphate 4-epimerase/fuculose-1-phosphate aldolase
VRDHGIYVWGDTWEAAKRHSECLHYLFNASIQMHSLGLRTPLQSLPHSCSGCDGDGGDGDSEGATRKRKHVAVAVAGGASTTVSVDKRCDVSSAKFVLLDIEGTCT